MYYGTGTYQTPFTFEGGDLRRRRTLSRQAASLSLNLCPGAATIGNSQTNEYVGYNDMIRNRGDYYRNGESLRDAGRTNVYAGNGISIYF